MSSDCDRWLTRARSAAASNPDQLAHIDEAASNFEVRPPARTPRRNQPSQHKPPAPHPRPHVCPTSY